MLTNLMLNWLAKPDFIAYKYADRRNHALRSMVDKKGFREVSWTIRKADDLRDILKAGGIPVFEKIAPGELMKILHEEGKED
jgi:hypothetical protein